MFGALRFFLAFLVVASHLVGSPYLTHFGYYAVRGFFVLSGFLMTAALNDVYGFDGARFWFNRMLRLLPPYFVVGALTLAAVLALPAQAALYLKFWRSTPGIGDIAGNLAVLPLQVSGLSFRLIPPVWSVAVEIDMYLLLYLAVARHVRFASVALSAGLSYQLACAAAGMHWAGSYFTAAAALVPFSAGALIYFARRHKPWRPNARCTAIALAAWLANMAAGGWLLPQSYIFGIGYYADTILFVVVIAGLVDRRMSPRLAAADRMLGDWAYPVFLLQWLVGFLVAVTMLPGTWRGWTLLLLTAVPITLSAAGLAALNRRWLEPLRDIIRGRAARVSPLTSRNTVSAH